MKYRIVDGEFGPYIQYFLGRGRFGKWCDVVLNLDDGGFIRWPFESRKKAEEWLSSGAISGSKGDLLYSSVFSSLVAAILLLGIIGKYFRSTMNSEEILAVTIVTFIVLPIVFLGAFYWAWQKYARKKEVVL